MAAGAADSHIGCAEPLPGAIAALAGCIVTRFLIDDSVTLTLRAPGRHATLRIDGGGGLDHGGRSSHFDPDADPASIGPLLALLHVRLDRAAVGGDGELSLHFAGGARLLVAPAEHSVTWTIETSTGARASCLAEGHVVWA